MNDLVDGKLLGGVPALIDIAGRGIVGVLVKCFGQGAGSNEADTVRHGASGRRRPGKIPQENLSRIVGAVEYPGVLAAEERQPWQPCQM